MVHYSDLCGLRVRKKDTEREDASRFSLLQDKRSRQECIITTGATIGSPAGSDAVEALT